jgi:hypothetical protein
MKFCFILYPDTKQEVNFCGYRWCYIQEYNKFIIKKTSRYDDIIDKITYSWEYMNMASKFNVLYLKESQLTVAKNLYLYETPILININLMKVNITTRPLLNINSKKIYYLYKNKEIITRDKIKLMVNKHVLSSISPYFDNLFKTNDNNIILTHDEFIYFEKFIQNNTISSSYEFLKILLKLNINLNNYMHLLINELIDYYDNNLKDSYEDSQYKIENIEFKKKEYSYKLIYIMDFMYSLLNYFYKDIIDAIFEKVSSYELIKQRLNKN